MGYARSKGYEVVVILEDVASGPNENRRLLNKLFDTVERKEIGRVVVAFKGRLTRFGFKYLERYLLLKPRTLLAHARYVAR